MTRAQFDSPNLEIARWLEYTLYHLAKSNYWHIQSEDWSGAYCDRTNCVHTWCDLNIDVTEHDLIQLAASVSPQIELAWYE